MEKKKEEKGIGKREMDKYRLYNANLEEAIETTYDDEKDKTKIANTNIWMSLWLRKIFADLKMRYNLPLYAITSRTIRLGTTIVEKEYKKKFERLSILWSKVRWIDNVLVQQIEAQEYTVNGISNAKRVYIQLPIWCSQKLGSITGSARSEKAGLIRLAMYHAISRSKKIISKKNKEYAKKEIGKFDKQIDDSIKFLEVIVNNFGREEE